MKKVLITGAGGLLGKKTYSTLSKKYSVVGAYHSKSKGLDPSVGVLRELDITNGLEVETIFEEFKPHFVVHTVAVVDVETCERDKKLAHSVNVVGTKNVAERCKKYGSKLVYISTDYVWGPDGSYTEESEPKPLNYYGETKLKGERVVQRTLLDYLIIRPTVMYGFNDQFDKETFASECISKLKNREVVLADDKRVKYPILIDDIADAIELLLKKGSEGIFNIATQDGLTKYQWAKRIAKRFGFPEGLIKIRAETGVKKPSNVRLITKKIEKLGCKIHALDEGIDIMKSQMIRRGALK